MEKSWYASKTIWASIVGGVVAVSTAFGVDLGLDPEAQTAIVGGIIAIVGVVLRFTTSAPIKRR